MKTFKLKDCVFEFNESVEYSDFYLENCKPIFKKILFDKLLEFLQENPENFKTIESEIRLMTRWIQEAPRKRFFRKQIKDGMNVMSSEYFFENMDDKKAEDLFRSLENTGHLAAKICEIYNCNPVGDIKNTDPMNPCTIESVLEG